MKINPINLMTTISLFSQFTQYEILDALLRGVCPVMLYQRCTGFVDVNSDRLERNISCENCTKYMKSDCDYQYDRARFGTLSTLLTRDNFQEYLAWISAKRVSFETNLGLTAREAKIFEDLTLKALKYE